MLLWLSIATPFGSLKRATDGELANACHSSGAGVGLFEVKFGSGMLRSGLIAISAAMTANAATRPSPRRGKAVRGLPRRCLEQHSLHAWRNIRVALARRW